jgi:hypothetical protein
VSTEIEIMCDRYIVLRENVCRKLCKGDRKCESVECIQAFIMIMSQIEIEEEKIKKGV